MRGTHPAASAWRRWRPPASLVLLALLAALLNAEIIDRMVAVVGSQAITSSDVERQIRLEAMLNQEPLEITPERLKEALQRLITLRLIHNEAVMAGFLKVSDEEVQRRVEQSRKETYLDGLNFDQALEKYGLQEQDVAEFWRQVIGFERFKDFRFKTGLEVSNEEVKAYYEQHIVPEFKGGAGGEPPPLEKIYDQVEQTVIEERANALLDEWLKEARPQTRIVILNEQDAAAKDAEATPAAAETIPGTSKVEPATAPATKAPAPEPGTPPGGAGKAPSAQNGPTEGVGSQGSH